MTQTTTNAELDNLIEEITVDCNDEDEVLMGFEGAFDENASLPCPGTVVGEPVELLSVSAGDQRRGLTATCQRAGRSYEIALLDINIHADPATSRLIAAYRRWATARAMRPDFTPADVTGIVGNPFYAINIAPVLASSANRSGSPPTSN